MAALAVGGPMVALNRAKIAQELRQLLYVQDINVAFESLRSGDSRRASELLSKYATDESGLNTTFEWQYLKRYADLAEQKLTIPPPRPSWVEGGHVRAVAFSPDDSIIAIGYWGHMARVVDAETGVEIRRIKTAGKVSTIALSPDGRFLAIGTQAKEVRLWNVATGWEIEQALPGVTHDLLSVSFSPDGSWLAASDMGRNVYLWPLIAEGETISVGNAQVLEHEACAFQVVFLPKSNVIAAGAMDGLHIWNVETLQRIQYHKSFNHYKTVAVSSDAAIFAVGRGDGAVEIWEFSQTELKQVSEFAAHMGPVNTIHFIQDTRQLVTAGRDGRLCLWNVEPAELQQRTLERPTVGELRSFDPNSHTQVASMASHLGDVRGMAVSHDGRRVATGAANGEVTVRDLDGLLIRPHVVDCDAEVWKLRYSPEGEQLFAGATLGRICIYDEHSGRVTHVKKTPGTISLDISPDGQFIAFGGGDWPLHWIRSRKPHEYNRVGGRVGHVTIVELPSTVTVSTLTGYESYVHALKFSPVQGGPLVAADTSGIVKLWSPGQMTEISKLPRGRIPVCGMDITQNGELAALGTANGAVELWDISRPPNPTMESELPGHHDWVIGVSFSPDGARLCSASLDGTAQIWDVQESTVVHNINVGMQLYDSAISPDGRTLVLATFSGEILLFDIETGSQLLSFDANTPVFALRFSPDGKTLATGGQDGRIIRWSLSNKLPAGADVISTPFR